MATETTGRTIPLASAEDPLDQPLIINPHLRVIHCSDNEILVKHGSRSLFSEIITDDKRTRLLGKVLRGLRNPSSLRELRAGGVLSEEELPLAVELVRYLRERGVLVEPQSDLTRVYLETIAAGPGAARRISTRTVGLVGAGYLGSRIARELAYFQPEKLVMVDPRRVTDTEASRRYLDLAPGTVREGLGFVECLQNHLSTAGFEATETIVNDLTDQDVLDQLYSQVDFVVAAWETFSPSLFHALNEAAIGHQKPWMLTYFDGSEAIIGPTYIPGDSPCYYEFEMQTEAAVVRKDEYLIYKEYLEEADLDASHIALPPFLQVAAGLVTTSALRFLIGGQTFTVGRAIRLDFERLSIDYVDVMRLPRCPACGPSRPPYRQLFL